MSFLLYEGYSLAYEMLPLNRLPSNKRVQRRLQQCGFAWRALPATAAKASPWALSSPTLQAAAAWARGQAASQKQSRWAFNTLEYELYPALLFISSKKWRRDGPTLLSMPRSLLSHSCRHGPAFPPDTKQRGEISAPRLQG